MNRGHLLSFLMVLTCFAGLGDAQKPQKPSYRLFQVVEIPTLQDKLNETASEGYRLVCASPAMGSSWAVIMELADSDTGPYKYLLITRGSTHDFEEQINQAGAKGFRLIPRFAAPSAVAPMYPFELAWMEKAPGPPRVFQYRLIKIGPRVAAKAALNLRLWTESNPLNFVRPQLAATVEEGYRIERLVPSALVVMERTLGNDSEVSGRVQTTASDPLARYRSVAGSKPPKVEQQLQEAAREGYHIADFTPYGSQQWKWPAGLLEQDEVSSTNSDAKYEYRVSVSKLSEFGQDLNSPAPEGFRISPQSLPGACQRGASLKRTRCLLILEKAPGTQPLCRYRLLRAQRLSDLTDGLLAASAEGFRVLGMIDLRGSLGVLLESAEFPSDKPLVPPKSQWKAKYLAGVAPIPGITDVRVFIDKQDLVLYRRKQGQFRVPLNEVTLVSSSVRGTRPVEEAEWNFLKSFSRDASACYPPEGCAGVVMFTAFAMLVSFPIKSHDYTVSILWHEQLSDEEIVLRIGRREYPTLIQALQAATGKTWRNLDDEWVRVKQEIQRQESSSFSIQLDRHVRIARFELRPGSYRLVLLEREGNRGELYFFSGDHVNLEHLSVAAEVELGPPAANPESQVAYLDRDGTTGIAEIRTSSRTLRLP